MYTSGPILKCHFEDGPFGKNTSSLMFCYFPCRIYVVINSKREFLLHTQLVCMYVGIYVHMCMYSLRKIVLSFFSKFEGSSLGPLGDTLESSRTLVPGDECECV